MDAKKQAAHAAIWGRSIQTRARDRPPPEYYWEKDHWSYTGGQHGDGRERAASEFARSVAPVGDADAFLAAVDAFHSRGRDCELIHVGPKKGAWLEAAMKARMPATVLEFGTQIGYSAILIGKSLPIGGRLWTIEPNPDNADLAESNIKHVGLTSSIVVMRGTFEDVWKKVSCPVDFVFLDHSRAAYLRELKGLERWGYIADGTLVVTDNIGGTGRCHGHTKAEEYATYVRESGRYASFFHWGDDDGIEVSECITKEGKPKVVTSMWGKHRDNEQDENICSHDQSEKIRSSIQSALEGSHCHKSVQGSVAANATASSTVTCNAILDMPPSRVSQAATTSRRWGRGQKQEKG